MDGGLLTFESGLPFGINHPLSNIHNQCYG